MKYQQYILLLLSAFLYANAFWWPVYCWWLVFLFPCPLLVSLLEFGASFWSGYYYGLCIFTFHLSGVIDGIMNLSEGSWYCRLIPGLLIIAYANLFPAFYFLGCKLSLRFFHITKISSRLLLYTFGLLLFLYIFDNFCLAPFGVVEGYSLVNPLIVLTMHPSLLGLLPYLSPTMLLLWWVAIPFSLVGWWYQKTSCYLLIFILAAAIWVGSLLYFRQPLTAPVWLSKIVPLPVVFGPTAHISSQIQQLGYAFKQVIKANPHADVIIMPESALYCTHLHRTDLLQLWSSEHLTRPVHIILGSFCELATERSYYNSLFHIFDGKLLQRFDKRHTMLLTERLPWWCKNSFLYQLYFSKLPSIATATAERPLLKISDQIQLVPYICSELFFNQQADDIYPDHPILAICNDRWFGPFVQQLMVRGAQYKAILWQRQILYISFLHQLFIDQLGNKMPLALLQQQE